MNFESSRKIKRAVSTLFLAAFIAGAVAGARAASLSPDLTSKLQTLGSDASVGVVIVSFNGNGLQSSHLNLLRSLGINDGVTFRNLGMVGAVLNVGQVRALGSDPSVGSIWTNEQLQYHMNHARLMAGADKVRTDAALTLRNGGMPVSGSGDFSVFVIDSGVDATHADLPLGTKIIQNTQRVVSTNTGNTGITIGGVPLNGLTPSLSIENVPNTDNVGHGTHVAATVAGTGMRSGGSYAGVAPGAKIVGSGGGVVIVVLDALAGWEYAMANQDLYRIRVITNSYGPINPVDYDPNHPLVLASKKAYDRNITVLWSASNDGAEDTVNAYAQAPFVIGVAAGSKDGMLAGFSSRGIPREQRLNDNNPFNDNEAPTITAPGTGRFFESSKARWGFTLDLVSARSSIGLTNLIAAGDDASEISAGMLPFYTQMSGTSMATPFTAGIVALMLDADPTLTPDEIKQILIDTATRMPGYQEHEVGAGYVNAHAAVDKVFNRNKPYTNGQEVAYNLAFGVDTVAPQAFHIDFDPTVSGPSSANARQFTVEAGVSVLKVRATVDVATEPGATNLIGLRLHAPDGTVYSPTFALNSTSNIREGIVNDPIRAKTPAPTDRKNAARFRRARFVKILVGIDRGGNDRNILVVPACVVGKIRVASHNMRREPDRCRGLRGELKIAEIPVRRALVRLKNGVIKIEDHRDSASRDLALKPSGTEQRRLTKQIDKVVLFEVCKLGPSPSKPRHHRPHFFNRPAGFV